MSSISKWLLHFLCKIKTILLEADFSYEYQKSSCSSSSSGWTQWKPFPGRRGGCGVELGSPPALDAHLNNWLPVGEGRVCKTSELTDNSCSADADLTELSGGCKVACHLHSNDQGQKQLRVGGTCQSPSVLTSWVREKMSLVMTWISNCCANGKSTLCGYRTKQMFSFFFF